ncbi:MAG: trigger factor family protein, partial [Paenibacillus macerans]|nr:trigger factor family protein [Paenibacillus macerans]
MKATWEKIEKNLGVLEVEVEAERVAAALDKAFQKVVKRANVPGFRKGKVPRPIFEARFGVESLYQDAIDILLPEVYSEAVDQAEIFPVDRPEVDVEQFAKGQPFKFKAKVTVKPEVKLGDYKG